MSIWQFDIHFIPSTAPMPHVGTDGVEIEPCWKNFSTSVDISARLAEKPGPARKVLPGWIQWGRDDSNRVDAQLINNHPNGLSARIDARSPSESFLRDLCELASELDCHFFSPEANASIEPNIFQLRGALSKSQAARFVRDPRAFLDRIAKGEGNAS